MLNWKQLVQDNDIHNWPYGNARRSKQCRGSWVQTDCPYCNGEMLLGLSETGGAVSCYQCGTHKITETIKLLLNTNWHHAIEVSKKYRIGSIEESEIKKKRDVVVRRNKSLALPAHSKIKKSGGQYLRNRGFSVKKLVEDWGAVQGALGSGQERRIILPITYKNELVSYIGRDITGKAINPYKKCKDEDEVVGHKDVLVGLDKAKFDKIIVNEGFLDMAKAPVGCAVCTLGIKWSQAQMRQLLQFKEVYIMFDGEPKAKEQAKKLAAALAVHNIEVHVLQLADGRDPGSLSYEEYEEICLGLGFEI